MTSWAEAEDWNDPVLQDLRMQWDWRLLERDTEKALDDLFACLDRILEREVWSVIREARSA